MVFDDLFSAISGLISNLTDYLSLLLATLVEAIALFGF